MPTVKAFVPFGPDAQVQTIDQMTVENDPKRVSMYGRLDFTHDQAGLDKARALSALLDAVVARLEAATALPDHTSSAPNTRPLVQPIPFAGQVAFFAQEVRRGKGRFFSRVTGRVWTCPPVRDHFRFHLADKY